MKALIASLILAATATTAFAQAEKSDPGSLSGKAKETTATTPAPNSNSGSSTGNSGKATPGGSDAVDSNPEQKTPNASENEKTTKTTPNQPK